MTNKKKYALYTKDYEFSLTLQILIKHFNNRKL